MGGQFKDYDHKNNPITRGFHPLIDGKLVFMPDSSVVGYCTSLSHRGFLTEQLVSQHRCVYRNCSYLRRFPEHPYWRNHKKELNDQLQKHIEHAAAFDPAKDALWKEARAARTAETQKDGLEDIWNAVKIWLSRRQLTEDDFFVLDISPFGRSTKYYRILYVSSEPYDDTGEYLKLAQYILNKTQRSVRLVHAKTQYGGYATIQEYHTRKKWK